MRKLKTLTYIILQFWLVSIIFSCRFNQNHKTFAECIKTELQGRKQAVIDLKDIMGFHWDTLYVTSGVGLSCDSIRKLIPFQIVNCTGGSGGYYFANDVTIILEEVYQPFWDEPDKDMVIISTNGRNLYKILPNNAKFEVLAHEYEKHVLYSLKS